MQALRKLLNTILGRTRRLREIDEELAFHLHARQASLTESGREACDASRMARQSLGNTAALRDQIDRAETMQWMTDLFRDLRVAYRALRARPTLSLTVVASVGISIGAASALFGFVDALLWKPLNLPHAEAVIALQESFHGEPYGSGPPRMRDWAAQVPGIEHVGGTYSDGAVLTGQGAPSHVNTLRTFGDMMGIFGEPPSTGRLFTEAEANGLGAPVALVTHRFYEQHYGVQGISEENALGRALRLNGTSFAIVGVMPRGRNFPPDTDVITPAPKVIQDIGRQAGFLSVFARIKPGVSLREVQEQLNTVNHRLVLAYPATDTGRAVTAQSVRQQFGEAARRPVFLLFSAALLLLLLADINVATLLLTRALERQKEAAVRLAIGAGRAALIRLYLSEALLLAVAGACVGVGLGRALFAVLQHMVPASTTLPVQPVFDWRICLFGVGIAMVSGLLFGLGPALQISGVGTARLAVTRQALQGRSHLRWRHLLVASQVALSMLLLTGVGLTARSLYRMRSEPLGFEPAQTVSASVAYPWDVPMAKLRAVTASTLEALARQPEVISSGMIDRLPLGGNTQTNTIRLEGRPLPPELASLAVAGRAFAGDYFNTMGIPLLAGRMPHPQADGNSPEIVVNETFARRFFPAGDALGHRILDHEDAQQTEDRFFRRIVGIVGDTRVAADQVAQPPETFLLAQNTYWPYLAYVARLRTSSPSALAGVRAAVQQADPEQIVTGPTTLDASLAESAGEPRVRLARISHRH
jgi:putative ABC transport system permease protein